ncbi:MAG: hypothetical protein H6745_06850 [Deltaproteobacteria bacterium]|nr:hypothetical protein [Deltaproteobacteria bacterium]
MARVARTLLSTLLALTAASSCASRSSDGSARAREAGPPAVAAAVAVPANAAWAVVVPEPRPVLAFFHEALSDAARGDLVAALGADPTTVEGLRALGVDAGAPIAFVGLSAPAGGVALIAGAAGSEPLSALRRTLPAATGARDAELAGAPALGAQLGDAGAAFVHAGSRLLLVLDTARDGDETATLTDIARRCQDAARGDDDLAHRAEFATVAAELPAAEVFAWSDTAFAGGRASSPRRSALGAALAELRGAAAAMSFTDGRLRARLAALPAPASVLARLFGTAPRDVRPARRAAATAIMVAHAQLDPRAAKDLLLALLGASPKDVAEASRFAEQAFGVDLERDVFGAWSGELGLAYEHAEAPQVVALGEIAEPRERPFHLIVGLADPATFGGTAQLEAAGKQHGWTLSRSVAASTEVLSFMIPRTEVNGAVAIDGRHLWLSYSPTDLVSLLRRDPDAVAETEAIASVSVAAPVVAYVRLGELLRQLRGFESGPPGGRLATWSRIAAPQSVLTARGGPGPGGVITLEAAVDLDRAGLLAEARSGGLARLLPGGDRASDALCRAAYANLTELSIRSTLDSPDAADLSEETRASIRATAEQAMAAQLEPFVERCRAIGADVVACMSKAPDIATMQRCATDLD